MNLDFVETCHYCQSHCSAFIPILKIVSLNHLSCCSPKACDYRWSTRKYFYRPSYIPSFTERYWPRNSYISLQFMLLQLKSGIEQNVGILVHFGNTEIILITEKMLCYNVRPTGPLRLEDIHPLPEYDRQHNWQADLITPKHTNLFINNNFSLIS